MTGIILLAAGESRRLGQPKQLVPWQGKPLLRKMAETALQAELGPVVVVLGAVEQPCREILAGLDVAIVHNPRWKEGMGGSISAGLAPWIGKPLDGVIVMLGDQPGVGPESLRALRANAGSRRIVASRYDGGLGPPAFFSPWKFGSLLLLEGEGGAKRLIAGEPRLGWVDAPEAGFDIDTPADLKSDGPR